MSLYTGIAWGEETPDLDEQPYSWQSWKDNLGAIITVVGDPDWGLADLTGVTAAYSPVIDVGIAGQKTFTLQRDKYETGSGSVVLSVRGAETVFAWDAVSPAWAVYTVPVSESWQYIQVRAA